MSRRRRKRIGRGPGSGSGKTSGRGMKGQHSRSGSGRRPWFEGGQMPLQRRTPKRGFKSHRHIDFQLVKVGDLAERFPNGGTVDLDAMADAGLIKSAKRPTKVLCDGDLEGVAITVKVHKVSASAKQKIEAAGGAVEIVPMMTVEAAA